MFSLLVIGSRAGESVLSLSSTIFPSPTIWQQTCLCHQVPPHRRARSQMRLKRSTNANTVIAHSVAANTVVGTNEVVSFHSISQPEPIRMGRSIEDEYGLSCLVFSNKRTQPCSLPGATWPYRCMPPCGIPRHHDPRSMTPPFFLTIYLS